MRVVQGRCLTLGVLILAAALAVPAMGQGKLVYVSVMDTEFIGEPTVRQVEEDLRKATDDGAYALVLLIDTPGGLFDSMNDVIQLIFSSSIPVVTFVAPKGADAASAGTFVTMAGHVAAMAPGTSIGAAQPVQYDPFGQGVPSSNKTQSYIETKVRSYAEWTGRPMNVSLAFITTNLVLTPKEALDAGVIDLIAEDVEDLVSKVVDAPVHGRLPDGRERISLAGAEVKYLGKSLQDRFTNFMSNPALAYLLFIVGIYGIIFGFTTPGIEVPEVVGAICLLLALYGLGIVGASIMGMLLVCLGVLFLVAEAATPGFGMFATAGVICLVLGALFLPPVGTIGAPRFYMPKGWFLVFRTTIVALSLGIGAFLAISVRYSMKAKRLKAVTGGEGILGKQGVAMTRLDPSGQVLIEGEIWKASTMSGTLEKGARISVIARKGLSLQVKGADG